MGVRGTLILALGLDRETCKTFDLVQATFLRLLIRRYQISTFRRRTLILARSLDPLGATIDKATVSQTCDCSPNIDISVYKILKLHVP